MAEKRGFHVCDFIFPFKLYLVESVQSPATCQHFHWWEILRRLCSGYVNTQCSGNEIGPIVPQGCREMGSLGSSTALNSNTGDGLTSYLWDGPITTSAAASQKINLQYGGLVRLQLSPVPCQQKACYQPTAHPKPHVAGIKRSQLPNCCIFLLQ